MAEDGSWGPIKAILDAGKGSIDFIAFALIAVLSVASLSRGVAVGDACAIAVVLAVIWVLLRYALLAIQSHERLRALRENATIEAQKRLSEHSTKEELGDLFSLPDRRGGDNER